MGIQTNLYISFPLLEKVLTIISNNDTNNNKTITITVILHYDYICTGNQFSKTQFLNYYRPKHL